MVIYLRYGSVVKWISLLTTDQTFSVKVLEESSKEIMFSMFLKI